MPDRQIASEIREAVAAQCDPYQFPAPWGFLAPNDDVRSLPAEPESLLTSLRQAYSDDALIGAGVAEADGGSIRLRAKLNAPGEPVFILRDRQAGVIVDMLTETGSVFEEELPIFSALVGEQLLLLPDNEDHEVLAVFSINDLVVLRSCGIPATLAVGIERLSRIEVDRFCLVFGLSREKSLRVRDLECILEEEEEASSVPLDPIQRMFRGRTTGETGTVHLHPDEGVDQDVNGEEPLGKRLVFVTWSPSALDRTSPAAFDDVASSLKELKQYLGVDLYEICVWPATSEDIDRLRFFASRQDAESIRETLLDRLYSGVRSLEQLGREEERQLMVPVDLPTAIQMLRESELAEDSDGDARQRRRESLQHVERLLHEQVIAPLMNESMASPDPRERALGLATAQAMQMFLTKSMIANARTARALSRKGIAGVGALPLEEIQELMAMEDRVSKLYRELDRCKQSTVNVIQVTTVPQSRPLALPNSV